MISPEVASTIDELLHGPVDDSYGTGTAAAIPGVDVAGKTGTTSNYVDAWFVGWTPTMTVAVWVGYPDSGKPMLTNFDGEPVEGGTYPAIIWHNFMVQAIRIMDELGRAHSDQLVRASLTTEQITPSHRRRAAPSVEHAGSSTDVTATHLRATTTAADTSTTAGADTRRPARRQSQQTHDAGDAATTPRATLPPAGRSHRRHRASTCAARGADEPAPTAAPAAAPASNAASRTGADR